MDLVQGAVAERSLWLVGRYDLREACSVGHWIEGQMFAHVVAVHRHDNAVGIHTGGAITQPNGDRGIDRDIG